jgi:predicted transposase/invertase (TIGR01784 family)
MYIPFYELDAAEEVKKRGIEEGKLEGRFEGKLEVARKLAARGISSDVITESTGLSVDQIQGPMS